MSHAHNNQEPSNTDGIDIEQPADPAQYESMRGCLTLSALIVLCAIIGVAIVLVFGSPGR